MFKKIYKALLVFIFLVAGIVAFSSLNIRGNIKFLSVQSGSMEPTIKVGSIVMVKPVAYYKKGDIVTVYDSANHKVSITHRINEITQLNGKKAYITKGDANNTSDSEPRYEDDFVGKVFLTIPLLGYVVSFARTQLGLIFLIIIPSVIIIYTEILNIKKHIFNKNPVILVLLAIIPFVGIGLSQARLANSQKADVKMSASVWEIPKLDFYFMDGDKNKLGFRVYDDSLKDYQKIDYLITYDSDQGIQGITGKIDINGRSEIEEKNLIIGTCSSGGTCSYNTGVGKIEIDLTIDGLHLKSSLNLI